MSLGFCCLLYGHDDRIRGDRWSLYVECRDCGRRSRGITLSPMAPPACPPGPVPLYPIRRRVGHAMRMMVKIMRLLSGLGAGLVHDGHRRA
jgi:hypothetical protein